jgi:outer membrane immunogenic protein
MKRLLVAGIAAAAFLSAPALAGPSSAPFNWSGFYVGVNGGGMSFTTDGNFPNGLASWHTNHKEVAIGGLHGGFQMQSGSFVYGIEGGWTAVLNDSYATTAGVNVGGAGPFAPCGVLTTNSCQARVNDILSVGPRAGFASGNWLFYATGGYARAAIETAFLFNAGGNSFGQTLVHHDGWYAGGGIDVMTTSNFVVGLEYKHYDFSAAAHDCPNCGGPGNFINANAKVDAVTLRLTIK